MIDHARFLDHSPSNVEPCHLDTSKNALQFDSQKLKLLPIVYKAQELPVSYTS